MADPSRITRRQVLIAGSTVPCAGLAAFLRAHAAEAGDFEVDAASAGSQRRHMHGGNGLLDVKFFFEPERPARPALFLQYDIPPRSSEGVHTHGPGRVEGAWDEYYYIADGAGRMQIGGEEVPVKAGDAVHTPLGVPHGIENTSLTQHLRVFLVAIERA